MPKSLWLETVLRDAGHAFRQFVRNPVFTSVAIASLAIGIGATTAIFSVMNAALLRSLPVGNPDELVILTDPNASGVSSGVTTGERHLLSFAEFAQLRDHTESFSGVCVPEAQINLWHWSTPGRTP